MEKYWPLPNEILNFLDFDVTCTKEEENIHYIRRQLVIINGNEKRKVQNNFNLCLLSSSLIFCRIICLSRYSNYIL